MAQHKLLHYCNSLYVVVNATQASFGEVCFALINCLQQNFLNETLDLFIVMFRVHLDHPPSERLRICAFIIIHWSIVLVLYLCHMVVINFFLLIIYREN